jgi:hypothetical protein
VGRTRATSRLQPWRWSDVEHFGGEVGLATSSTHDDSEGVGSLGSVERPGDMSTANLMAASSPENLAANTDKGRHGPPSKRTS